MIKESVTDYGRLLVGAREELFAKAIDLVTAHQAKSSQAFFSWALTGGSTPQEWWRWCVANRAISGKLLQAAHFTVSDERVVPLHSEQSNFGNAERLLFSPLQVPAAQQHPWPVEFLPAEAVTAYARDRHGWAGPECAYDVCFLGMGDDGHTASIFPGSPLLKEGARQFFAAVEVPGKGWRLTITPAGLATCGLIVVMTLGSAKAPRLKRVLKGAHDPQHNPIQLLREWRSRVVWLADSAAAAGI